MCKQYFAPKRLLQENVAQAEPFVPKRLHGWHQMTLVAQCSTHTWQCWNPQSPWHSFPIACMYTVNCKWLMGLVGILYSVHTWNLCILCILHTWALTLENSVERRRGCCLPWHRVRPCLCWFDFGDSPQSYFFDFLIDGTHIGVAFPDTGSDPVSAGLTLVTHPIPTFLPRTFCSVATVLTAVFTVTARTSMLLCCKSAG